MSYYFLSPKSADNQELSQWDARSLQGEIDSFEERTIVQVFKKYLTRPEMKIMEGGCGLGAWCEWFAQHGHQAIGIEHNTEIVTKARQIKSDLAVEYGDVTDLNYPDNYFDVYVSLGVIEHFEQGPEAALLEARRVLKSGGLAIISTPYLSTLRRVFAHPVRNLYFFINQLRGRPAYFWEYRFTRDILESFIRKAGFEIITTEVDDYNTTIEDRHMGLWTDWFFLRQKQGDIWELNGIGKQVRRIMRIFPPDWYCAGIVVVARINKAQG